MNKRTAAAALIAVATLTLIGCGTSRSAQEVSTPTTAHKQTTTTTASPYGAFLSAAQEKYPAASDSQLIDVGITTCDTIETFGSVLDMMVMISEDPDWSLEEAEDAAFMIGLSVPTFCPKYQPELNRLVR
jgi:hypothetical protein